MSESRSGVEAVDRGLRYRQFRTPVIVRGKQRWLLNLNPLFTISVCR